MKIGLLSSKHQLINLRLRRKSQQILPRERSQTLTLPSFYVGKDLNPNFTWERSQILPREISQTLIYLGKYLKP